MDIVDRARDYARNLGGPPEEYLVWQLADEIERLRAALRNIVLVPRTSTIGLERCQMIARDALRQDIMQDVVYPADVDALQHLGSSRQDFEAWMDVLDVEHVKQGSPYGADTLVKLTGVKCWIDYFKEGSSPKDALDEDLSYD